MAKKILLLDQYTTHAETLRSQIEAEWFRVQFETEVEPLCGDLGDCDYLIIFEDEALQGKAALEMFTNVKTVNASLPVVMVASHWNIKDMVQIANTDRCLWKNHLIWMFFFGFDRAFAADI